MANLYTGTSGWEYDHWRGNFYPPKLAKRNWLHYYAEQFNTAEVNYSFYKLPRESTYEKWLTQVTDSFLFTLKCSRLITHAKRLKNLGDTWQNFLNNALTLEDQLGPILCQLPENFEADIPRLKDFLETVKVSETKGPKVHLAFEFRNESWFTSAVYRVLEKYNAALVCASSSKYPRIDHPTADFAYFRYHGPGALFGSNYSKSQLEQEAKTITKHLDHKLNIFAYFNNDTFGYAPKNAQALISLINPSQARAS